MQQFPQGLGLGIASSGVRVVAVQVPADGVVGDILADGPEGTFAADDVFVVVGLPPETVKYFNIARILGDEHPMHSSPYKVWSIPLDGTSAGEVKDIF